MKYELVKGEFDDKNTRHVRAMKIYHELSPRRPAEMQN